LISPSEARPRVRARGALVGLALAAATVAVLVIPGTASASKVQCAGKIAKDADQAGSKTAAAYSFLCDKPVLGYTVTFNKSIGLFDTEVLPTVTSTGVASGELVSCEGDFPGAGFGCTAQSSSCPGASSPYTECTGDVDVGNTVASTFETTKPYCDKKRTKSGPLTASLIVSTIEFTAAGKSFVNSSQPFKLSNTLGCKPPKPPHHH
jgi:hypothetical protein